jgi:hypothetical protein
MLLQLSSLLSIKNLRGERAVEAMRPNKGTKSEGRRLTKCVAEFFEKIMDLSLPIFTLFSSEPFCMECIEFTTRTYNFKNLAEGSLIWSAKPGVN